MARNIATMKENSDKHVVNVHARARKDRREVISFPHTALGGDILPTNKQTILFYLRRYIITTLDKLSRFS